MYIFFLRCEIKVVIVSKWDKVKLLDICLVDFLLKIKSKFIIHVLIVSEIHELWLNARREDLLS